jgi:hypothetical protein
MGAFTCSFPRCTASTDGHRCDNHRAFEDARVTCLFCRGEFDSLPFYGCCSGCYTQSAIVRILVDVAHPLREAA